MARAIPDPPEPLIPRNGGSRPSELLMKVAELLDDRLWHPLEAVIKDAGKVIPPGKAMRVSEKRRQARGGPPER